MNQNLGLVSYSISGGVTFPARTVFDGANHVVAFSNNGIVEGTRIDPTGKVLDTSPRVWSQTRNDQDNPEIAFGGADGYLATWLDTRDGPSIDIYSARLGAPGQTSPDGNGIKIASLSSSGGVIETGHGPDAGTPFLVAWYSNFPAGFRAARVTPGGQLLDPGGFGVANVELSSPVEPSTTDLACARDSCLLVWASGISTVMGIRIGYDGTLIDPAPFAIQPEGTQPRVTTNGTEFLVSSPDSGGTVYLVQATGASTPTPIQTPSTLGFFGWNYFASGQNWVIAWPVANGNTVDLKAVQFDDTGKQLGTPATVASGIEMPEYVGMVDDGTQTIVLWIGASDSPTAIHAARFSYDGSVIDPGGVEVDIPSTSPVVGQRRIVSGTGGQFLVADVQHSTVPPDRGYFASAWFVSGLPDGAGGNGNGGGTKNGGGCGCRESSPSPANLIPVCVVALLLSRRRPRRSRVAYVA